MRYKLLQAGLSGKCISIIKAVYRNVKKRGKSPEILQYVMDKLCTYYKKWNIVVYTNKIKVVVFRNGWQIEIVNSYVYWEFYSTTIENCTFAITMCFIIGLDRSFYPCLQISRCYCRKKDEGHIVPGNFNLPKPDNLIRAANRPAEPT
jgi:hypothetical protein